MRAEKTQENRKLPSRPPAGWAVFRERLPGALGHRPDAQLEREPRAVAARAPQAWARWVCQERAPDGRGKLRKKKRCGGCSVAQKRWKYFVYICSVFFFKKRMLLWSPGLSVWNVCAAVCLPSPFSPATVTASPGPAPQL